MGWVGFAPHDRGDFFQSFIESWDGRPHEKLTEKREWTLGFEFHAIGPKPYLFNP